MIHALISVNLSLPGQNGRHFADDIFECIFMNEKLCISIQISLKFVPEGPIDNKAALPEPRLTHITEAYMRH